MPAKVYLQQPELVAKSRHHRSYAGDGAIETDGKPGKLYTLEFFNGVAKNVDEQTYQRFKELGHCDTTRPYEDDND